MATVVSGSNNIPPRKKIPSQSQPINNDNYDHITTSIAASKHEAETAATAETLKTGHNNLVRESLNFCTQKSSNNNFQIDGGDAISYPTIVRRDLTNHFNNLSFSEFNALKSWLANFENTGVQSTDEIKGLLALLVDDHSSAKKQHLYRSNVDMGRKSVNPPVQKKEVEKDLLSESKSKVEEIKPIQDSSTIGNACHWFVTIDIISASEKLTKLLINHKVQKIAAAAASTFFDIAVGAKGYVEARTELIMAIHESNLYGAISNIGEQSDPRECLNRLFKENPSVIVSTYSPHNNPIDNTIFREFNVVQPSNSVAIDVYNGLPYDDFITKYHTPFSHIYFDRWVAVEDSDVESTEEQEPNSKYIAFKEAVCSDLVSFCFNNGLINMESTKDLFDLLTTDGGGGEALYKRMQELMRENGVVILQQSSVANHNENNNQLCNDIAYYTSNNGNNGNKHVNGLIFTSSNADTARQIDTHNGGHHFCATGSNGSYTLSDQMYHPNSGKTLTNDNLATYTGGAKNINISLVLYELPVVNNNNNDDDDN